MVDYLPTEARQCRQGLQFAAIVRFGTGDASLSFKVPYFVFENGRAFLDLTNEWTLIAFESRERRSSD
jgi:hypothetical protein